MPPRLGDCFDDFPAELVGELCNVEFIFRLYVFGFCLSLILLLIIVVAVVQLVKVCRVVE